MANPSEKLGEMLKEDVEAGRISWNDYERSKSWIDEVYRRRHAPFAFTLGAPVGIMTYRWYRGRPLFSKGVVASAFAGFMAIFLLESYRFRRFINQLEDHNSVLKAIQSKRDTHVGSFNSVETPHSTSLPQTEQIPRTSSSGRWDEIRKETEPAHSSVWDRIRQDGGREEIQRNAAENGPRGPTNNE